MPDFILYNVVLENHSVQNSPWRDGGILAAHGLKPSSYPFNTLQASYRHIEDVHYEVY